MVIRKAMFDNSASTMNQKVHSPSKEYLGLPEDVRTDIERHLGEYPVKLGAIAKRLGVKVLLSTLPRGTSGQIKQESGAFVIRINRHEAKHRQRFTLAHELAHYLLHRDLIIAEGGWSENVLLRSGQPENVEYEANRLAFDLVVPSEKLAKVIEEYKGSMTEEVIEHLAKRFRVSKGVMEVKLQTL